VQQNDIDVGAFVVHGETLWYEGRPKGSPAGQGIPEPASAIYKRSLRGGVPVKVDVESYVGGAFGVLGTRLVTLRGKTTPVEDGWLLDYPNVLVHDTTSGKTETLQNPRAAPYVYELLVHPAGVYWTSGELDARTALPIASSISRWDPATGAVTEIASDARPFSIFTDGKEVFYERRDEDEQRFEAVAVTGGQPRTVKVIPHELATWWMLEAVDASALYLTRSAVDENGKVFSSQLIAMDRAGSHERILSEGICWDVVAATNHVYWADMDARLLMRVPRTGGTTEVVWEEPRGDRNTPNMLAADTCNIYWTTSADPRALWGKSL
jgi:hypothetical protein